jgi:ArsR family transcriptional regulator
MNSLKYFKALADETRLRLLNILIHHELKVGELVSIMDMGQSRISRHLKILAEAGLVDCWREGVWGLYFIVKNGPARRFIDSVSYLFDDDPLLGNDLQRAIRAVEERTQNTRRFFNTMADSWDRLKQQIIGDFDLSRVIFNNLGRYEVAVDLGCGTGDLLEGLRYYAAKVIGVDSAPGMLEEARKRFSEGNHGIDIRLGEIEHLPLGDNEADLAVISLVLQYLPRPETAVSEVSRVLRAGGDFILADFEQHANTTLRATYGVHWLGFDPQEITRWLAQNNFELITMNRYPLEKGLTLVVFHSRRCGT